MSDIVWEDPPAVTRPRAGGGKWVVLLQPLIARPEKWARVAELESRTSASSLAAALGGRTKTPSGRWEFTSRSLAEGRYAVYARYLGPAAP